MNKIYKKLLVAAGAVAMLFQAAPASAAPTLDQLTGSDMMYYGTLFRAYDRGECIPFINQDITIEKVGANSVIFRNFYNEGSYVYDLPATYDENKGAFTVNYNTQFYKSGTTTPCGRYFRKFNKNTWLWRTPVGSYSYNFEQDWFPNWDQSAVVATVTPFDGLEGGYHIRFETWAIDDNGVNLNSSTHEYDYSSLYVIMAYPANAIVSDEYYRTTTSATNPIAKRTYTVNVSFSNPTNFNIVNFCEQGAGFDNFDWDNMSPYVKYDVNIDGQINADGTVSLGNLRGDDDMRNAFSLGQNLVYRNRRGTLYFVYNGYVYTGASNVNTLMDHYYYKGIPNGYNGDVTENITGTWHYGDIYHNNYGNGWAKYVNGGTCETRTGDMIINLDPYVLVYGSDVSTKTKDTDWVKNTQITYPGGNDITFNAIVNPKISHKASDTDSEGLGFYRFNVSVSDFVNTENVESVEVYYIEGAHNHCSSVNHSNAVKMGTIKDFSTKWDSEEKIVYPTVTKDPDTGVITNINKDYSFYLKANYKTVPSSTPETKQAVTLDPTYHALTAASSNDITTAVDLNEATGLNVEDVDGGIIVHAEGDAAVQVYNMSGMLVAAGNTNETIAIDATGVMVVRVNGKVFKIMK